MLWLAMFKHYLTISDLWHTLIGYENYHNALCLAMKTIRRLGPHEWELNRVADWLTYKDDSISGYSCLRQVATKIIHYQHFPGFVHGDQFLWVVEFIFYVLLGKKYSCCYELMHLKEVKASVVLGRVAFCQAFPVRFLLIGTALTSSRLFTRVFFFFFSAASDSLTCFKSEFALTST